MTLNLIIIASISGPSILTSNKRRVDFDPEIIDENDSHALSLPLFFSIMYTRFYVFAT